MREIIFFLFGMATWWSRSAAARTSSSQTCSAGRIDPETYDLDVDRACGR